MYYCMMQKTHMLVGTELLKAGAIIIYYLPDLTLDLTYKSDSEGEVSQPGSKRWSATRACVGM